MLLKLDVYLLSNIFNYIKGIELINLIKTTKKFKKLVDNNQLWEILLNKHYNWNKELDSKIKSYYDMYFKAANCFNRCFMCNRQNKFYNYIVFCYCFEQYNHSFISIHEDCIEKYELAKIETSELVLKCPMCYKTKRAFLCSCV